MAPVIGILYEDKIIAQTGLHTLVFLISCIADERK
jgi:hypothetical protein